MSDKYLKANIRLDKIRQRNLKPSYKHLSPDEKKLVKAIEKVDSCEKEIRTLDRQDSNWRNTELGSVVLEEYYFATKRKEKVSNKLNLTESEENNLVKSCHTTRFSGGSF